VDGTGLNGEASVRRRAASTGGFCDEVQTNMHTFRLWAPDASTIELVAGEARIDMQKFAGGWWFAEVAAASAGTPYGYRLNHEDPLLPDTRSLSQPSGIHGRSCLIDPSALEWTDTHWQARPLTSAVIYEMHVGTFTPEGTFDSAIEKLAYLAGLGITHLELMPVNEFSGRWGWGYDGVDLFAPHHAYGGPDGLKRLVNAAHEHGWRCCSTWSTTTSDLQATT
jgi:maltooligosyltrehalose trehalohydrolase